MDVKDFSKYLKHKSFDELLHHVRRISLERVTDNEADNLKKMKILRDTAK